MRCIGVTRSDGGGGLRHRREHQSADHGERLSGELGILSVDIDGNDYWVLEAIDCVDPAIIICEINGCSAT